MASLLLAIAAAGLRAAITKETTKNTLRSTVLNSVSAGQATKKASNTTGAIRVNKSVRFREPLDGCIVCLEGDLLAVGAVSSAAATRATVSEEATKNTPRSALLNRGRVDGGDSGQGRGEDHGVLHLDGVRNNIE